MVPERRDNMCRYYDILKFLLDGPRRSFYLLCQSHMDNIQYHEAIKTLTANKLVKRNSDKRYTITPKGRKYVDLFYRIRTLSGFVHDMDLTVN